MPMKEVNAMPMATWAMNMQMFTADSVTGWVWLSTTPASADTHTDSDRGTMVRLRW